MSSMRAAWNRLAARYAALSQRERRLVAAAAVVGPLLIGKTLLVDPFYSQADNLRRTIAQRQASGAELEAQAANLRMQLQADPDAARKSELAELKRRMASFDERLKQLQDTLVAPEEMNALLERLLARHSGLRLISLKTLAPESIVPQVAAADGKPARPRRFDIYRHAVELRLEGSYLDLLAYIEQLEKADKKMLWGSLQFAVIDHPRSQLTLVVYTLSSDKAWLAI